MRCPRDACPAQVDHPWKCNYNKAENFIYGALSPPYLRFQNNLNTGPRTGQWRWFELRNAVESRLGVAYLARTATIGRRLIYLFDLFFFFQKKQDDNANPVSDRHVYIRAYNEILDLRAKRSRISHPSSRLGSVKRQPLNNL